MPKNICGALRFFFLISSDDGGGCPLGGGMAPFIGGTRSPMGPRIHGNIKSGLSNQTDLEQRHRLNLGGGGEPT